VGNGSVALTYANIISALGYTPENVANKSDSYTASSSTTYASTKALVDGLASKVAKSGDTMTGNLAITKTGVASLELQGGNGTGDGSWLAFKDATNYKGILGLKGAVYGEPYNNDLILQNFSDNIMVQTANIDKTISLRAGTDNEIGVFSRYGIRNTTGLNSYGLTLKAFGDSYTASGKYPPDSSVGPSTPDNSWIRLFAKKTQLPLTIHAVNGSFLADQMSIVYANAPSSGTVSTYYIGTNDDRYYTTDNQIFMWGRAHKEQLAFLSLNAESRIDATEMTAAGTWGGAPYANGKSSATAGSTLTFKTKGSSIMLSYLIQNGNTGSFTVEIDGVSQGTFNKPYSDNVGNYLWATDFIPQLVTFDNLSNQEHTIVITVVSATTYIYWASSGNKFNEPASPKTITSTVNTLGATAGSTDSVIFKFNDVIRENVNYLARVGLDVALADNGLAIDKTSTYLIGDDTHPNDFANNIIANNFLYAYNGNQNLASKSTAYASLLSPVFTGTPTAPTATAGTNTTQIATTAFVQGIKALTVRKISTNTTLADSDNGTIILLTASCTVTLPNGLMSGFNCSFSTQTGATMTYALGGSVTLINNVGTTMAANLSHTIVNTGTSNEYLTAGSL